MSKDKKTIQELIVQEAAKLVKASADATPHQIHAAIVAANEKPEVKEEVKPTEVEAEVKEEVKPTEVKAEVKEEATEVKAEVKSDDTPNLADVLAELKALKASNADLTAKLEKLDAVPPSDEGAEPKPESTVSYFELPDEEKAF